MPTKTKTSKRELIEPSKGDKRFVRRKSDGTFGKTVDVGKSLSAYSRTKAKRRRRRLRATAATRSGNPVAQSPVVVDNAAIAELLIREAETASRGIASRRSTRGARGLYVAGRSYGHRSGRPLAYRVSGHWTLAREAAP